MIDHSKHIVLVYSADDNYAMPLAASAKSAIANLRPGWEIELFILDGGITAENKAKIATSLQDERVTITWLEHNPSLLAEFEVVKRRHYISNMTFGTVVTADLIPETIEQVIYLDVDVIVKGDLVNLWCLRTPETLLWAVQDSWTPFVSSPEGLKHYQNLGIPRNAKYFNAGVLLINLDRWRQDNIRQKAIDYVIQFHQSMNMSDQECLNAVLAQQWRELDPCWNQMPQIYLFPSWRLSPFEQTAYQSIKQAPHIIHFAGSAKPWIRNWRGDWRECILFAKHPWQHLFFKYLDMTPWAGWRLEPEWKTIIRLIGRQCMKLLKYSLGKGLRESDCDR
jgi:lipopolysaccharide biosynthesis glycosyltransferase